MKIRIKKTKQIDEISAMGVAPGGGGSIEGGGGPFKKKEELQEDGEIAANTIGASRSVGNKNIRKPYYDEEEPVHDDQKTLDGMKERAAHQGNRAVVPEENRAINPQGKLLGEEEEEDLDEGSMMGTVGTAVTPGPGSGHSPFDGETDVDVGDWNWWAVKKRRCKQRLNRAYSPETTYHEMTAHINESTSFDDMDSVDREFFADRPTIGTDGSISTKPSSAVGDPQDIAIESLKKKGYELKEQLGQGQNGTVYLSKSKFKQPCAIKIVIGDAASKELTNYQTIDAARSRDPLIAKHFPNVYESWSPQDRIAIIVMELLKPIDDNQASVIPDASFLAGKYKGHRLASAADSYSDVRDLSKRLTLYVQNNLERVSSKFRYHSHQLTNDWDGEYMGKMTVEKMDELAESVSQDNLLSILQMFEANPAMGKQFISNRKAGMAQVLGNGSAGVAFIEVLESDAPSSNAANAVLAQIAFKIMVAGVISKQKPTRIDEFVADFAKSVLAAIRKYTAMPMGYNQYELGRSNRSHEVEFLTSKGLHAAIQALHKVTGLMAKDLHDQNIMSKSNGDLVIVDVGLFRADPSWSPNNNLQEILRIRKKMLRNLRK